MAGSKPIREVVEEAVKEGKAVIIVPKEPKSRVEVVRGKVVVVSRG